MAKSNFLKRFTGAALIIIMIVALIPAIPQTVKAGIWGDAWGDYYGDLLYFVEDGVRVVIRSYTGSAETVEIPAYINNVPVRRIDPLAFADCKTVKNVTIPNTVTDIGWQTFANCTNLTSVTIPKSVVNLGDNAFTGCTNLKSVIFEEGFNAAMGAGIFENCPNLPGIRVPNSLTQIGRYTFTGITIYCKEGSAAQIYADKYDTLCITDNVAVFPKPTVSPFFNSKQINPQSVKTAVTANTTDDAYYLMPWSYVPYIQTVINPNGNVSVMNINKDKNGKIYIYEYSPQGKYLKEIGFTPALPLIGAFTKDKDGNYYILYAKEVGDSDLTVKNVALIKYSPDGKKSNEFWLEANDLGNGYLSARAPFAFGTCRLEISGSRIAAYYAKLMFNGHQASTGFVLKLDNFERLSGDIRDAGDDTRKSVPYGSHSFNQFILPVENSNFIFAGHGDAYPRSFFFHASSRDLYSFGFYGEFGQNETYAEMGGLTETSDGYVFVGAYAKNSPQPDVRNMFLLTINKEFNKISSPIWLTGFASNSGNNVVAPKIVRITDDKCLIMWMIDKDKSAYCMVVDSMGNIITPQKKLPSGVFLNRYDVLRYNPVNGLVYWAVSGGNNTITLYSLDTREILPKVGDPLGDVLYSDITAYINGYAIPTSVIKGRTLVTVEDLAKYGFNVVWNGKDKTLKVELNKNKVFNPIAVTKDTKNKPGTFKEKYVYTDITTYLSGQKVTSYAIKGATLIDFEALGNKYGTFKWDAKTREIRLVIN